MIGGQPVVIANEIRLHRSVHKGVFLVLEGRDDRLFYERFICAATCKIKVAPNKPNVCEVIRILDGVGFPGVIGIIDSDFDEVEGRILGSANIFRGHGHDLEGMLLQSSALDAVLIELGSSEKIARFGRDPRAAILAAAFPVSCLRLYSERNGGLLRFKGVRHRNFVSSTNLEIDRYGLVQEVKNCSQRQDIREATLIAAIDAIAAEGHDPWKMCAAPDLLAALSVGLRGPLGNNDAASVRDDQLRRALRLAYTPALFSISAPKQAIQSWEAQNVPFRVLP